MWMIVLISVAFGMGVIALLARSRMASRERSAKWNDLHERGKMFVTQMAELREISEAKRTLPAAETKPRVLVAAKTSRSFWPRPPAPERVERKSAGVVVLPSRKIA